MSEDNSNYPPGTWDADPDAPWNAPEAWVGMTCAKCRYFGYVNSSPRVTFCGYAALEEDELRCLDPVKADDAACEEFDAW